MKNDIYNMLNEASINLDCYEKESSSYIEKKNMKAKFRKSIAKNKNYKKSYIAAAVILAVMITLFGTNIGGNALASVAQIAEIDIGKFLGINKKVDDYKTVVNKAVTDNGITVQLNEVVVDGTELMVFYNITSDKKLYEESFWHAYFLVYVNGEELYNDKYFTVPKNKDDYTTQAVTGYNLKKSDLSGELNIKIVCKNVYLDDISKDGEWNFEFNTNGEGLKVDTKEIPLSNKFILENGETYTLEKYTDNSIGQKIYASISNPIKESEYDLELNGTDDLGNRVSFIVKLNDKEDRVFKPYKNEKSYGDVDKNAKTLTLNPVQVKYVPQFKGNDKYRIGEYKIIGDPFTIDLTQLK
jgi:hypothetical protein